MGSASILTWMIHITCYCKQQWLAPERNARSVSLNVGFTTSRVGIAALTLMHRPFRSTLTQQCESSRLSHDVVRYYSAVGCTALGATGLPSFSISLSIASNLLCMLLYSGTNSFMA